MKTNTLEVDRAEYAWQLRHGWLVEAGRGLKGVSVSVWVEPGVTRELIVDFPFGVFGHRRPSQARLRGALPRAIHEAIEAGWDQHSRGKTFRIVASTAKQSAAPAQRPRRSG